MIGVSKFMEKIMRGFCLLFLGVVSVSFGMDRDFRVNTYPQGMIQICEQKARLDKKLSLNQLDSFQGFVFCNFAERITLRSCCFADHFGSIEIYSDKPLSIEGFLASECKIFAPEITILGEWTVDHNLEFIAEEAIYSTGSKIVAGSAHFDAKFLCVDNSTWGGHKSKDGGLNE